MILQILLVAALAAPPGVDVPGPVTTVEDWQGLPTFLMDGEPHMPTSFETYVPNVRHFRQMSEAGADVFGFPANCGEEPYWHSTPVWVGPGVWDFSEFDENVGKILEANPDAYIMPRINVSEPEWWREKNPSELMVYHDGTVDFRRPYRLWPAKESRTIASMSSRKWRKDMADSLRRLIAHIQNSDYADRVFAYQIYGQSTEEWYHYTAGREQFGDYSPHAQTAFRAWLEKKYGSDTALQEAWGDPEAEIALAMIPSKEKRLSGSGERTFRDPGALMHVIDFYAFWNAIMAEAIDYFCGVVKEESHGQKAVGAFYAYMYEFSGNPESGHLAVRQLLESENVDFIVVTASYGSRHLGSGGSILRSPHTSLRLHGKLWYEDNDTVSYLFPEVAQRIGDAEWERSKVVLAATDSAEESRWIYERGAGFVLGNGVYQAIFDLHGGYFDDPELLEAFADIYRVFRESAKYDRTSVSEILVVADEESTFYCTDRSPLLRESLYVPPYRLIKCGAPYDSVYVEDLALLEMTPYKLVIVLNAYHMTESERRLVASKLFGTGATILWGYAPGLFQENECLMEGPSATTGMALEVDLDGALAPSEIQFLPIEGVFTERLIAQGVDIGGSESPVSGMVQVVDPEAIALGKDRATGNTTLAMKDVRGVRSIYTRTLSMPPSFYRELARDAGVHIYNDRDDTIYISKSYLTLNADGAGEREIHFPDKVDVYDPKSDELLAEAVISFTINLRDKETAMLRVSAAD